MQTALTTHSAQAAPITALRSYEAPARPAPETPATGATKVFAKDEEIFAECDRAGFFYKVVSGAVRSFKLLSDGRRQIDAFHLPGDIFGLGTGDEHRFGAEAVGNATVIAYRRSGSDMLLSGPGAFSREVLAAMMVSLERAQNHMLLLGRKSALEKIATFLLDLSARMEDDAIELPMSRTDIADHLGLTIETVSRSLTQLERRRIIDLPAHRRSIVLRDKPTLRRIGS
jgi:CRP/FNR family nitrogen fixation transcriptional regulator